MNTETTTTRRLQLADGSTLELTLSAHGVHELLIADSNNRHARFNITGDDLRRLAALPGVESCGNCHFARIDANGVTRCHRTPPRKRGTEVYFTRMNPHDWCGKHRALKPVPPPRTEPREVAA